MERTQRGARSSGEDQQSGLPPEVLDSVPDAVIIVNSNGTITFANREALGLFDTGDRRLIGASLATIIPGRYHAAHRKHLRHYFERPRVRPMTHAPDLWAVCASGAEIPVDILLAPVRYQGETQTIASIRDATERRRTLDELRVQEQRLRALFDENPGVLLILDRQLRLIDANKYAMEFLQLPRSALVGTPILEFVRRGSRSAVRDAMAAAFKQSGSVREVTMPARLAHRPNCRLKLSIRAITEPDVCPYAIVHAEDITESTILSRRLSYQSTHDYLTGLRNRFGMEHEFEGLAKATRAPSSVHTFCFIDLDHFKVVNDTCGHVAGDEILARVATLIRGATRSKDIVARFGGDEFAVLFTDCGKDDAQKSVHRMIAALDKERFAIGDYSFRISLSAGLAEIDCRERVFQDVIQKADAACYAAKEAGRNRMRVYADDDLTRQTLRNMHWAPRIQQALDKDEFVLFGQEIARVADGAEESKMLEILIRLQGDDGGLITPDAFLPAAERYGLSSKIDYWVTAHAIAWLESLPEADRPICTINLSGASIGDTRLVDGLGEMLRKSTIDKTKIVFEITETAAVSNFDSALEMMARLRKLGCRFALDDFGIGMSSFSYLRRIPVEIIKIAGDFIKNVETDPLALLIAKSIGEIAHATGRETIAEYVESESILRILRSVNIDFAQGYGIARPRRLRHAA